MFQDGHEICFVGDEAFRELSQVDPKADELIDEVRVTNTILGGDKPYIPTEIPVQVLKWLSIIIRLISFFTCGLM